MHFTFMEWDDIKRYTFYFLIVPFKGYKSQHFKFLKYISTGIFYSYKPPCNWNFFTLPYGYKDLNIGTRLQNNLR